MVDCKYWQDINNPDGGKCNRDNITVSLGVCAACQGRPPIAVTINETRKTEPRSGGCNCTRKSTEKTEI